jgi:hypothetical protein
MKADIAAVTVRISAVLDQAFRDIAEAQDKPLSRVYRAAFEEYAKKYGVKTRSKTRQSDPRSE